MIYIRNIIKAEMILCEKLALMKHVTQFGVKLPASLVFTEINIKKPCGCDITDKIENKVRVFTSKLTFKTCDDLPQNYDNYAYRITSVDGNQYMIGDYNSPYPVTTTSEPMPDKESDSSLKTVTVSWIGLNKVYTVL